MKQDNLWILFVLFTVILWSLFQLSCSVLPAFAAFLNALFITILIAVSFRKPLIREGLNHKTKFVGMVQNGAVSVQIPDTNTTNFTFNNYKLDGTTNGTINVGPTGGWSAL